MCVIAYAKNGVKIPKENIKKMFYANNDGAGICWKDNKGFVHFKKGFMTCRELIKAYEQVQDSSEVAIHCRLATHGTVNQENCHPFIIGKRKRVSKLESDDVGNILMHNGVIHSLNCPVTYNDSRMFAEDTLRYILDEKKLKCIVETLEPTSKFVIMRKKKPTILCGDFTNVNGVMYSNLWWDYRTCYGMCYGMY